MCLLRNWGFYKRSPLHQLPLANRLGSMCLFFFSRSFCGKNSGDVISFSGLIRIIFSFFSGMLHQGDCFTLRWGWNFGHQEIAESITRKRNQPGHYWLERIRGPILSCPCIVFWWHFGVMFIRPKIIMDIKMKCKQHRHYVNLCFQPNVPTCQHIQPKVSHDFSFSALMAQTTWRSGGHRSMFSFRAHGVSWG